MFGKRDIYGQSGVSEFVISEIRHLGILDVTRQLILKFFYQTKIDFHLPLCKSKLLNRGIFMIK